VFLLPVLGLWGACAGVIMVKVLSMTMVLLSRKDLK
jgi:hypothetical protein